MSDKQAPDPKSLSAAFTRALERESEAQSTVPAPGPDTETEDLRAPRMVIEDPHPSWAVPTRHRPDLLFPPEPPSAPRPLTMREAFLKAREPGPDGHPPVTRGNRYDR